MNGNNNDLGSLIEDTARLMNESQKGGGNATVAMIIGTVIGAALIVTGFCLILL